MHLKTFIKHTFGGPGTLRFLCKTFHLYTEEPLSYGFAKRRRQTQAELKGSLGTIVDWDPSERWKAAAVGREKKSLARQEWELMEKTWCKRVGRLI